MLDGLRTPMAESPLLALVATAAVAAAVYVVVQLAFDREVDLLETGMFVVVFAAFLAGLSLLRQRAVG